MELFIERNNQFAESNVTVVGITKAIYGRPQYFLVNSDKGSNERLKFPGLQFRSFLSKNKTLEDSARDRFEEQTGLTIDKMLGLRAIVPVRSKHSRQWMFSNVFFALVSNVDHCNQNDGERKLYVADPGQGISGKNEYVNRFGDVKEKTQLKWISPYNHIIARIAKDVLLNFDWENLSTDWYRKIPCVGVEPQTSAAADDKLGCGLAVVSMIVLYQPNEKGPQQIILVKRKGDLYPGYAGGKVESLRRISSKNIDPISCCIQEGAEEFGFSIQPRAIVCCANTTLNIPNGNTSKYYNCIINYAFIAEPTNILEVEDAIKRPKEYLERKMECYVIESLDEHRDRILRRELRMPDMVAIGKEFYTTSPGNKIPLTQIISTGSR